MKSLFHNTSANGISSNEAPIKVVSHPNAEFISRKRDMIIRIKPDTPITGIYSLLSIEPIIKA